MGVSSTAVGEEAKAMSLLCGRGGVNLGHGSPPTSAPNFFFFNKRTLWTFQVIN
jgi:hypothetical protein